MRTTLTTVLAIGLVAAPASFADDLAVGSNAPGFTLEALDGKTVSLADHAGKLVVLEWINPNCPFTARHAAEKTMTGILSANPDIVWLAINSTNPTHKDYLEPKAHSEFNDKNGINYPVLYDRDGSVARAYGAKTTPHMFVISTDGTLLYNGAIDDNPRGKAERNYVVDALAAIAAGTDPDPAATKPYGCTLKL